MKYKARSSAESENVGGCVRDVRKEKSCRMGTLQRGRGVHPEALLAPWGHLRAAVFSAK